MSDLVQIAIVAGVVVVVCFSVWIGYLVWASKKVFA